MSRRNLKISDSDVEIILQLNELRKCYEAMMLVYGYRAIAKRYKVSVGYVKYRSAQNIKIQKELRFKGKLKAIVDSLSHQSIADKMDISRVYVNKIVNLQAPRRYVGVTDVAQIVCMIGG